MADAVGLWVIVYFCVTSVNTKDMIIKRKPNVHTNILITSINNVVVL